MALFSKKNLNKDHIDKDYTDIFNKQFVEFLKKCFPYEYIPSQFRPLVEDYNITKESNNTEYEEQPI